MASTVAGLNILPRSLIFWVATSLTQSYVDTMASKHGPADTERDRTDQKLQGERAKTDDELRQRQRSVDQRADAVVDRARDRASALLQHAREQADDKLAQEGSTTVQRDAVQEERTHQDAVVQEERRTADNVLHEEREERERALRELLGFEREQTDHQLLIERARGDAVLTARDELMGMVSHDVRTLLGGIAMGAAIVIKNSSSDDAGRDNARTAQRIQRLTARVGRLVSDLVDVASIEEGRLSMTPTPNDANELIKESLEAFELVAAERKLKLNATFSEPTAPASFDHDRILQVLANLLSNACKFAPEGTQVDVRIDQGPDELRISVTNPGTGIPKDQVERIFERFWQVTKGDLRGLGLGLFISKSIVEAHGGRIWADSEEGKFTTVTFTLPTPRLS